MRLERIKELLLEDLDAVTVLRYVAVALIFFGVVLIGVAGYDEYRGVTDEPAMTSYSMNGLAYSSGKIAKISHPKDFRNAMEFNWGCAILILLAGMVLKAIIQGQDRGDALLPDTDPNIESELLQDERDDKLLSQKEQHKSLES